MLDAPAKAEWPPLFTANGHWYSLDIKITVDTSEVLAGLKTHCGLTAPC